MRCAGAGGRSQRLRGYSLIELMITVVVLLLVLAASVSLGQGWIRGNKVAKGQGLVQQGYSVAKAYALQNINSQTGTSTTAAVLCLSNGTLSVYLGSGCTGTAVWSGTLPDSTSLTVDTPAVAPVCFGFSNQGLRTQAAGTLTCSLASTYTVTSGSSNVSRRFF